MLDRHLQFAGFDGPPRRPASMPGNRKPPRYGAFWRQSGTEWWTAFPSAVLEWHQPVMNERHIDIAAGRPVAPDCWHPSNPEAPTGLDPTVAVDTARRQAVVHGRRIDLTRQEFQVLAVLCTHRGVVFSREALLSRVWPAHSCATPKSVDTVICRLRQKIERDPGRPVCIVTVRGFGYRCADAE